MVAGYYWILVRKIYLWIQKENKHEMNVLILFFLLFFTLIIKWIKIKYSESSELLQYIFII